MAIRRCLDVTRCLRCACASSPSQLRSRSFRKYQTCWQQCALLSVYVTQVARLATYVTAVAQILKSDLIPASVADEQITDLLRAMPEHPGMYERVVEALFASSSTMLPEEARAQIAVAGPLHAPLPDAASVQTNDTFTAAGAPRLEDALAQGTVVRAVRRICTLHGAVPMTSNAVSFVLTASRSPLPV
jgi:hypothetical protein